jgi:hypothetical protein
VKWEALMQRKYNIMANEKGQTCGTRRVTLVTSLVISYIVLYSLFLTFPLGQSLSHTVISSTPRDHNIKVDRR